MSTLTERIKSRARSLGFDKVGVVAADALSEEATRLRQWLARDYHGTMGWMAREPDKRGDPKIYYPQVRSVLCVALNYYSPEQRSASPAAGKISRYAWGEDYHKVMKDKLGTLLEWVRQQVPEADGKIAVDTSPVLDKAWAVRAGLGWLGKHSNVITTDLGSWIFLGELLLNIVLDYDDDRVPDHCGTCNACVAACPTGAIVEDYVVDATRCISYGTIEYRGEQLPIPTHGWIYGCDICQDVCPWNCYSTPTAEPRFQPRPDLINPSLEELESISDADVATRFRTSAIRRAKASGLRRNARAAKGVSGVTA